jgi:hypothetical protein
VAALRGGCNQIRSATAIAPMTNATHIAEVIPAWQRSLTVLEPQRAAA